MRERNHFNRSGHGGQGLAASQVGEGDDLVGRGLVIDKKHFSFESPSLSIPIVPVVRIIKQPREGEGGLSGGDESDILEVFYHIGGNAFFDEEILELENESDGDGLEGEQGGKVEFDVLARRGES